MFYVRRDAVCCSPTLLRFLAHIRRHAAVEQVEQTRTPKHKRPPLPSHPAGPADQRASGLDPKQLDFEGQRGTRWDGLMTARKGTVVATKSVEIQGNGTVLATYRQRAQRPVRPLRRRRDPDLLADAHLLQGRGVGRARGATQSTASARASRRAESTVVQQRGDGRHLEGTAAASHQVQGDRALPPPRPTGWLYVAGAPRLARRPRPG